MVINVLIFDIIVSDFEIQSRYYIYIRTDTFGKGMNFFTLLSKGLIVPLLSFYKKGFGSR